MKTRLYIKGLVKFSRQVEDYLNGQGDSRQTAALSKVVHETIARVESICRQVGVPPGELPAPTSRAYQFLKSIDFDHPPAPNKQAGRQQGGRPVSRPPKENAAGRHYHLDEVFRRVNRQYFGGQITRPHLSWSRVKTFNRFGSYRLDNDSLMVSKTLDDPGIPLYVVDYIMFHELLHKKLGVTRVNGRQYSHTPEFHRAEKQYPQLREAKAYLKEIASK